MDKFEHHELYPLYEAVCMQENGQYAEGLVKLLRARNVAFRNNDQNTVSLCDFLGYHTFFGIMYHEQWKPRKLQPQQIYECLLQICVEAEVKDDDPQALAAFWLGRLLIEYSGKLETGISWVEKSLDLANNNFLKLSIILVLATQYLRADNLRKATEFCQKLKDNALAIESQEYVFYALAFLARIQCFNGNFGEACRALLDLKAVANQFSDDKFFSGMVKAVESVICILSYNPSAAAEPRKAALQLLNQYIEEFGVLSGLFVSGLKMPCFERHHVASFWIAICDGNQDNTICDGNQDKATCDGNKEIRVKMTNLQNSVIHHLENNKLEEAEACTAEMLQLAESSECVIYVRHTVFTFISQIVAQYHTHEGKLHEEGLEIIESFFHGWLPFNFHMRQSLLKRQLLSFYYFEAQKFDKAVATLQECLEIFLREVDSNFASYSTGRIFYLENVHHIFHWLQ